MSTVSATRPAARAQRRSLTSRLLVVFPLIALVLTVLVFYAIEAASRKTPSIFSDELEWTQLSRAIAATGHAARRSEPTYFKSVYAYLIAPVWWWISSTLTAYAAIKYLNAILMPLAAIPTYLLARMLVTKRAAVIVAVASIAVPAMAYVTSIVPEVIGYPYYALCSWLAVRALRTGRRLDVWLAIGLALGGYFIRQKEFSSLPIGLAIAAGGLWLTGTRGKHWRRNWSRFDTVGAVVLGFGAFYLFNRVVLQHVHEWSSVTLYYKNVMIDLGLRAGLSLAIGLGLLPVIGGLVSLRLPERKGDPTYRAFAAWTAANIVALSVYTADKAVYLEHGFATLWEERNLVYLSPLLLIGTAMVFEAKKLDRLMVVAATGFVLIMILFKPIQTMYPYYEAPGSTIPAMLSHYEQVSPIALRWALVGMLAFVLVLLAARRRRAVAIVSVSLLFAWLLAGEIGMTVGIDHGADHLGADLYTPKNWIDQATGGQPVALLGQSFTDDNPEQETEFWNRSIDHVYDLDGTAPGPGPRSTTGLGGTTGLLQGYSSYPYVLTYNGVQLAGTPIAQNGPWSLYRKHGPWRLAQNETNVYADGWCNTSPPCSYTYYVPNQKGTLYITLSRKGYNGSAKPGKVKLRIGDVRLDSNNNPQLGHVFKTIHTTIPNFTQKIIPVHVRKTPVRVEVRVANPITPAQSGDSRLLGTQVNFQFEPAK